MSVRGLRPRLRLVLLSVVAVGLAAAHWGERLILTSRPLDEVVVRLGGEWRSVGLSEDRTLRYAAHRIDEYCFSPGVGAVLTYPDWDHDSLIRIAIAVLDSLAPEALRDARPNVTVHFERRGPGRWPWRSREDVSINFHYGGDPGTWKLTTYGAELGRAFASRRDRFNDSTKAAARSPS